MVRPNGLWLSSARKGVRCSRGLGGCQIDPLVSTGSGEDCRLRLAPQLYRKFNTEPSLEEFHVSKVLLGRNISLSVAKHLNRWRKTPNMDSLNLTLTAESGSGENPIRPVRHPVNTVTSRIKHDGVNIDLQTGTIRENKVGSAAPSLLSEAMTSEKSAQPRKVGRPQNEVEVLMWARLLAESRSRPARTATSR